MNGMSAAEMVAEIVATLRAKGQDGAAEYLAGMVRIVGAAEVLRMIGATD